MKAAADIVVGAGVAGLTAALKLLERGRKVVVIEKEESCGGLARSFRCGESVFDIGPHRFFSPDPAIMSYVHSVLDGNVRMIRRRSGLHFMHRRYGWPFTLADLLRLPLSVKTSAFRDLFRRECSTETSYESYLCGRYGRTVYELFFRDYTEKFLGLAPSEVDGDWAALSVERAVIDPKIRAGTLWEVFRQVFSFSGRRIRFLYPREGGVASFPESLAAKIRERGGRILNSETVTGLVLKGDRAVAVRTKRSGLLSARSVVWTAPLTELVRILKDRTDLSFRSTVLFLFEMSGHVRDSFQWCYFGEKDVVFSRVSIPVHFSSCNSPAGFWGLCAEAACSEKDKLWNHPDRLLSAVIGHLVRTREIPSDRSIRSVRVERIPNTYPVYRKGYREEKERCLRIVSRFRNIRPLGRCGTFWYNNMDQSIGAALSLAGEM